MKHTTAVVILSLLANVTLADVLVREDFEDDRLAERGWYDIAKWGEDRSLSIAGSSSGLPCRQNAMPIKYPRTQ